MGDYDQQIDRSDLGSHMLEDQYSKEVIEALPTNSFCLKMMKSLPPLSAKTYKVPMIDAFPSAYWVSERSSTRSASNTKKTTAMGWDGVTMYVEEAAVIVPVPESVVQDMAAQNYDLWGMVKPRLVEAIGVLVDRSILFNNSGDIAPALFPDGIVTQAIAQGNELDLSDDVGAGKTFKDLADAIMAENGVFSHCELDGYDVNGCMGGLPMKGKLRGLRDANGQFLFLNDMKSPNNYILGGAPLTFPNNGAWDNTKALLLAGDWSQAVYGIRQDITWKIATEASIHDSSGALVANLFQDDMVALRVTFRMGWALPNPKNLVNTDDDTRFPFAVLQP